MARLMKDHNNRYLIEVAVARKYVHCIIKDGTQVRCKKYHLTKLINNSAHEGGACPYAEWWHPVPETEYPLAKAIGHFLEPLNGEGKKAGWTITEKAKATLESLRDGKAVSESELGDDEVTPMASAVGQSEGESDMSKKAKTKTNGKTKKDRGPTIGALVCELLKKKQGTEEILKAVKKAFPKAQTTANNVAFYRHKMRKEGTLPKA